MRMNFDGNGMFPLYVILTVLYMHFLQYWAPLFSENFKQTVKQESNPFYVTFTVLLLYNYKYLLNQVYVVKGNINKPMQQTMNLLTTCTIDC